MNGFAWEIDILECVEKKQKFGKLGQNISNNTLNSILNHTAYIEQLYIGFFLSKSWNALFINPRLPYSELSGAVIVGFIGGSHRRAAPWKF